MCEYPNHDIETGLADVVKTLMVAFFFGPFIPMCYILSILGISLYYLAEKVFYKTFIILQHTLLRRKTVKTKPSFELTSNMTSTL